MEGQNLCEASGCRFEAGIEKGKFSKDKNSTYRQLDCKRAVQVILITKLESVPSKHNRMDSQKSTHRKKEDLRFLLNTYNRINPE
jgi:hypothetical protein